MQNHPKRRYGLGLSVSIGCFGFFFSFTAFGVDGEILPYTSSASSCALVNPTVLSLGIHVNLTFFPSAASCAIIFRQSSTRGVHDLLVGDASLSEARIVFVMDVTIPEESVQNTRVLRPLILGKYFAGDCRSRLNQSA